MTDETASGRLQGRVALVTGAASGLGRAIATAMAQEGAAVACVDRHPVVEGMAEELAGRGCPAVGLRADVASREVVEATVAEVSERLGAPDVLVCAAGIAQTTDRSDVLDLDDAEWNAVMDVNLRGTFLCAQTVSRRLVADRRPGAILTVASLGAFRPGRGYPAYSASKGGVVSLTRALALSLAPHGIRVNALAPGYILTAMTQEVLERPADHDILRTRIPLRRMGTAEEVATVAVFLASEDAGYMTGQVLIVDGGAGVLGWTPAEPLRAGDELA